jgi:DNA-binding CsgD family transcriptional regulator
VTQETTVLQITPSERNALQSLAAGESASETAGRLGLTADEMEELLNALFDRMGVETEREAVAAASKRGLVDPDRHSGRLFTRLTQWATQG